ncbi:anti-anti-sigma factor [Saccharomonospora amisosensis]|uniref:Anti-sigma factor antagonist n=2 Tax=Saccharomonospora amisosensis TaxID=1128677 RepID=A0A7X5ZRU9_9PSEU|nr:anti-sigma factor antagonist [Saccharomonospora amisosensis]NIJ13223.1 anti-anti-sigma factor [Saccharomonospora amisosensis]
MTTQPTAKTLPGSLDTHGMHIEAEQRSSDVVLVRVSGEVDLLSAPELRRWVREAISPDIGVVLELDGIGFLGSAGLSVLAELSEQADREGLRWAIVATKRVVLRPLEATGLVSQMSVHGSTEDAINALTRR